MINFNCYYGYVAILGSENHCVRPTVSCVRTMKKKAAICFFVVTSELRNWCHGYVTSYQSSLLGVGGILLHWSHKGTAYLILVHTRVAAVCPEETVIVLA